LSDAEIIKRMRVFLAGMARQKAQAHDQGARFHLLESGSVIDALTAHLNGADSGGAQAVDKDRPSEITRLILNGAPFAIGAIGFSTSEKP
jgi:hypothetical protein